MDVKREVTEKDFRKPEFIDADPKDYEFRADGAVVRKDRWERGIRAIWCALNDGTTPREDFEIGQVVRGVKDLIKQIPAKCDNDVCYGPVTIDGLYEYIRQTELDSGSWDFGCSCVLADNSILLNANISGYKDASIVLTWVFGDTRVTITGKEDVATLVKTITILR